MNKKGLIAIIASVAVVANIFAGYGKKAEAQPIKEENKLQFENQMKGVSARLKAISFPVSREEESIAAGR